MGAVPHTGASPAGVGLGLPSAEADRSGARMRIGEVAELTGTTPRTIRYYEELGLLGTPDDRIQGKHRSYGAAEVERIREIVRLRDLLGLSLDQLSQLLEAETARAEIRAELSATADGARRRELIAQAGQHIETQLGLVQGRIAELRALEATLLAKRARVTEKLVELGEP